MISLLVTIIVLCLIFSVAWWVITQIPLPPPFDMIVRVVFGLVVLLVLIDLLVGGGWSFGLGRPVLR